MRSSARTAADARLAFLVCAALLGAACSRTPEPAADATRSAPSRAALGALEYRLLFSDGAAVRLADGRFAAPTDAPAPDVVAVALHPLIATGDLDGDRSPDATVVLIVDGGGSGSFYELAVVLNEPGGLRHAASVELGDRIDLKSLTIDAGRVRVEFIGAGPNDAACCPTRRFSKAFALESGKLVEVAAQAPPSL